jgi:hypothetical protein
VTGTHLVAQRGDHEFAAELLAKADDAVPRPRRDLVDDLRARCISAPPPAAKRGRRRTCVAYRNARSPSQSRAMSASSSARMRASDTISRAAAVCSARMASTVAQKSGWPPAAPAESARGARPDESARRWRKTLELSGVAGPEGAGEEKAKRGAGEPGAEEDADEKEGRRRASAAARRSRFVVPSALVLPERAEHTTASLWSSR